MKRTVLFCLAVFLFQGIRSQETWYYTDPSYVFKQAKDYFQKENYSLAYPMFRELRSQLRETDESNSVIEKAEINYYTIVCELRQNEETAAREARSFIEFETNEALRQKMAFQLGEYYFRQGDIKEAVPYYERTSISNLSNREVSDMKFHQGYGYFTLQQFDKAKPLLNAIRQMADDPNYLDANYYYGFIAYYDREYNQALDAFRKVENHPEYGQVVPYYITNIQYYLGKKEESIAYAEKALQKSSQGYYNNELKHFLGHAYFEKGNFSKALPYLQTYVGNADKVTREDLYKLSYCYYSSGKFNESIDGFKQLSGGEDSLSQSAMYLLGDAYLKTGQKANARNAFSFCATNSSNPSQREVSKFNYGKLSYELGYQDIAIAELQQFLREYPSSSYNAEARELLVGLLANTNNYREAMALLDGLNNPSEEAKKLYPRVAFGRAMELINDQNLQQADQLLDRVIKDPNNGSVMAPANFWKGELAYRQNHLDDAIKYLNAYLKGPSYTDGDVTPQNANYNLGYCYLRKENYKLARGYFEKLSGGVGADASDIIKDAYLRDADCYYMDREYSRAKTMYARAISYSWPASDYATYQNAMIAGVSSPTEKINLLKSIESRYPGSELIPFVEMEIARTYLANEKYNEAIPYLKNVINSGPEANGLKPDAYQRLGIAYYNLNNNKEALATYKKLVETFPNTPEAAEVMSSARAIYVAEGRTSEYVDFMRSAGKTVSASQEDSLTWTAAENKYLNGDMNGAVSAFNDYLNRFPDGQFSMDALYYRSEIFYLRKDWKNALPGYESIADKGQGKYAEKANQRAAYILYFELQDYGRAEKYFAQLKEITTDREVRLDAMRGLLRSQHEQQKWTEASANARDLLKEKSLSTDDKVLANLVLAKALQEEGKFEDAIQNYRSVVSLHKAAYGAEARYEIAHCYLELNDLKNAEKAGFETINKSGSYDYWITKAYILLGEVFYRQKDYFNAKATLQSVVDNSKITSLKTEAQKKLEEVERAEKAQSKLDT